MKLTILFDLDDTLLVNDVNKFLPAYIRLLSQQLSNFPADRVIHHLLAATQKMVEKASPALTLEETFNQHFYPALGTTPEAQQAQIDHFYANAFPSLRPLTSPQPGAQGLMNYVLQQGHDVVVATNPLFPRTAIEQRLDWAGFPVESTPIKLVTNFSSFHFSKPHPAFYAEILAQSGWQDQPAVMLGDNLKDDLLPAAQLGMPVYWLNQSASLPEGFHPLSRSGSFAGILPWLKIIEASPVELNFTSPQALLAVLKSTPAAFHSFVRPLTKTQWKTRPARGEWCLTEIMCHLRDVEREISLPRIRQILREENPFLPGILSDTWASQRKYCRQDGSQALVDFCAARTELIELLQQLTPQDWLKPARHAIFGPTHLQELTSFMVTHDKNHIRQAFQLLPA